MKCVRETSKGQKRKDKMLHIFFSRAKIFVYVCVCSCTQGYSCVHMTERGLFGVGKDQ